MTAGVALPVPGHVAAGVWTMVAAESTAGFSVRDKVFTTTRGTLPVRSGTVRLGPGGTVESARVELEVDGIATGIARRDGHLRGPRFLAAAEHPLVVVQAGPAPAGPDGWRIPATLTARGATVELDLTIKITATDEGSSSVHITGRLDRRRLDMKVPTFIIGRMVDIDVAAVFTPSP